MDASRRTVYGLTALALLLVALSLALLPPSPPSRLDAISRENANLLARQEALRRAAFELADEVYLRVEHDRRVFVRAGTINPLRNVAHSPPPSREAGNDAILAWLSEQSSLVQTLPPDPAARP